MLEQGRRRGEKVSAALLEHQNLWAELGEDRESGLSW